MTVSTPPPFVHNSAKRKYSPEEGNDSPLNHSSYHAIHRDISPRLIKKPRPKAISAQSLRGLPPHFLRFSNSLAKTVSRLFEGQRHFDRGDMDVEMTFTDREDGRCTFCESPVDEGLGEEERTCLQCARTVCGKCGVRQYLSEGDYVACLECVQYG